MADSPEKLIDELKRAAKERLITSFFGTGIVGRTLQKKYITKQPSEKNVVDAALVEQSNVQRQINTTIIKLEPLVVSIAKTVNRIAAVWSKHVFAKKEQLRQRREQASKEKSAEEEDENERKQAEQVAIQKESLTGTTSADTASDKGGLLGAVISSSKSTKSFVRGALLKLGALLVGAGAVTALATGTIYGMKQANEDNESPSQENEDEDEDEDQDEYPSEVNQPPEPANRPSIAASDISPPAYLAAQEAGIAGIASTPVSVPSVAYSNTPSSRTEEPLSFQKSIDATAGEGPSTIRAISQPSVSVSSPSPLPPPVAPYTNQPDVSSSSDTVVSSMSAPLGAPSTQVYNKQIDVTAGEGPSTIQAPVSTVPTPTPPQQAPVQNVQQFYNTMQQAGSNIDSPASLVSAMSNVASSFTGTPSSLTSAIAGGLSTAIQAIPSNVGGLSDFVAPKVELGNQISSMTAAFQNLLRNLTESVTPVSVSQSGTTNQDTLMEGDSPPLPTPVADRNSLDIGTTFESQY